MHLEDASIGHLHKKIGHHGKFQRRASKEKRKYLGNENYHFHIQCTIPIKLVAFMRKRHLNSSSTSQNTLYYLQKDSDGINIPITTLRHTVKG